MMDFNYDVLKNIKPEKFFLLAGPCVIEDETSPYNIAETLCNIASKLEIPLVFKASYKKANRTRLDSFVGIGDKKALMVLKGIKERFGVPIITDIHTEAEARIASEYADILQIPAFLCRQTDLLIAAAKTNRIVNIKKGQFISGESMKFAVEKVKTLGNDKVLLTERGSMFGYQDLVVDFRNIYEMRCHDVPVVMDITHSLQQPNQGVGVSGGRPELIGLIARSAIAAGADGIFMETHPDPANAKSDGANMLELKQVEPLLKQLLRIKEALV